MDEQVTNELRTRQLIEFIVDGFLGRDFKLAAAAAGLAAQFPPGDLTWETSCQAMMTMVLQDMAEYPGQKRKFVDAVLKMILDTWHEIDTGKAVLMALDGLKARGRVVKFIASDNTFLIDNKGPFTFDDILDEASRL